MVSTEKSPEFLHLIYFLTLSEIIYTIFIVHSWYA